MIRSFIRTLLSVAGAAALDEVKWIAHDASRKIEDTEMRVARRLPRGLRRAVLVDCAVRATDPDVIGPHEYAGPDGLTYERMWRAL